MLIEATEDAGVLAYSFGGHSAPTLTAEDLRVRGVRADPFGTIATGVWMSNSGPVKLRRVQVESGEGIGIGCVSMEEGYPTEIVAEDITLSGQTAPQHLQGGGGLFVENDCTFVGRRVAARDNDMVGVWIAWGHDAAQGAPRARLTDLEVSDTRATKGDGRMGYGVMVATGGQVEIERASLVRNRLAAVGVGGWGGAPETRVQLTEIEIRDTRPSDCSFDPNTFFDCAGPDGDKGQGTGIAVTGGSRVFAERFLITGSAFGGVVIDEDSFARLTCGVIRENSIGLWAVGDAQAGSMEAEDVLIFENHTDVVHLELKAPLAPDIAEAMGAARP